MGLIFGSARIAETGHAGWEGTAQAGDQKQKSTPDYKGEVSMQSYYTSSKGWYVFRTKDPAYSEPIAQQMQAACNNANIGYDQSQRDTLLNYVKANNITDLSKVAEKVETDCSALVRVIVYVVTGKDIGNLRTVAMPDGMPKSGLFLDKIAYKSSVTLYNGDILVTKTSGHTGIICSGRERPLATVAVSADDTKVNATATTTTITATTATVATTSEGGFDMAKLSDLKKGSTGNQVRAMQELLIAEGYSCGSDGPDGDFGKNTLAGLKSYQTAKGLTVDGVCGQKTWSKLLGVN